jgi:cysteine desulfurase
MQQPIIYLDYSASTPVDQRVLDKMLPYFQEHFGNPSSQHRAGWQAQRAVDQARTQVARLLNARRDKEIVFTSGASEANTLAILGYIQTLRQQQPERRLHALTSQVEHKSILATFEQIQELGVEVEFLPTNSYGQIEPSTIQKHLRPETVLMSFMWANNEVGSLNPMKEIAAIAQKHKICLHSDATQACGKIAIDLQQVPVDLLSLSGHKMYGPKGVGALFVRYEGHHPAIKLWPIVRGGGQEYQLRAGTLNVPGIVGLGEAAQLGAEGLSRFLSTSASSSTSAPTPTPTAAPTAVPARAPVPAPAPASTQALTASPDPLTLMAQNFLAQIQAQFPGVILNGHPTERLPGHLHLSFPGIRWDQWLPRISQLCVSTSSACSAGSGQGSHVLQALGFDLTRIHSSVRISLGKYTTEGDIEGALSLFQRVFNSHSTANS